METKTNTLGNCCVEFTVKDRYAAAANKPEAALCCPVEYNKDLLKIIPREVIEKDYGCGDPSRYLNAGETVLDLGSGTGKLCFIAAQIVGAHGHVIGVDMTDEMLEVARRNAPLVAERVGFANVSFRKGRIQDLRLDLEILDTELKNNPIADVNAFLRAPQMIDELRTKHPLVPSESVDVVISSCVLNLVEPQHKRQLFHEIFRVLRGGGRAVISDIVSDQDVLEAMQQDPTLWSGCISGALREDSFLRAFAEAGFNTVRLLKRDEKPWQTVQGIEFRSISVEALKGQGADSLKLNPADVRPCCNGASC
jgi:arsenite methyltransferase